LGSLYSLELVSRLSYTAVTPCYLSLDKTDYDFIEGAPPLVELDFSYVLGL